MTNKLGGPRFDFYVAVKDKKGELVMGFIDEDGEYFTNEQAALARVADAQLQYPGLKVSVEKIRVVDFDAVHDATPNGRIQRIPDCPLKLPEDLVAPVRLAAELWRESLLRPRVTPAMQASWSQLIDDWIADATAPLLIRKSAGTRGQSVQHRTGRLIVPVDNTPAHWALGLALTGRCPSLAEVHNLFDQDAMPIAMALTKSERALAKYTGKNAKWLGLLNRYGWKVCHVVGVGLKTPAPLHVIDIGGLSLLFRALIDPSNMFLVPLAWAGFGELPDVLAQFSSSQPA